jgi:molybdopterin-guanine dinucleotide biosynthesis protein A
MGADKAEVVLDGERLVDRAARRLAAVADPVLVAPGRRGRIDTAWPQVDDVRHGSGPLAGVTAVLAASPRRLVAVVAVDLVDLDAPMLAWLATLWDGEAAAIVPRDEEGRAQPLHAVYAAVAAADFGAAVEAGTLALRDALSKLDVREVGPDEWGAAGFAPGWSRNVNRPGDLPAP